MIYNNLKIEYLNDDLKGVVKINNNPIVISGVLPGEIINVDFDEKNKEVRSYKIISKSPSRVVPKCPIYNKCGGCTLQHVTYNEQKVLKTKLVEDLFMNKFKRYYQVNDIIGMDNPYHYRNKNQIVFKNAKGGKCRLATGFYEEGTHNVIDFDGCLIGDEVSDKITQTIKELMIKMHYNAYDEDRHTGLIRHVLIKRSEATKEIMVVIVTGAEVFPGCQNFVKALVARHKDIKTVIQNINMRQTSAVLGEKEKILYGKGYIFDILLGNKFKISAKSFYQVNSLQCAALYKTAIEMSKLSKNDVLLDAYCGVGTIGIIASKYVAKVIGVELVKEAVNDAIFNAKNNNIKNIHFFCDDAAKFMVNLTQKKEKVDVVIMDPPRKGSDAKFLNACMKLQPKKIIYISCNPRTQVEDLELLINNNYAIKEIQPVDMFPQTSHVETITLLSLKEPKNSKN